MQQVWEKAESNQLLTIAELDVFSKIEANADRVLHEKLISQLKLEI